MVASVGISDSERRRGQFTAQMRRRRYISEDIRNRLCSVDEKVKLRSNGVEDTNEVLYNGSTSQDS